MLCHKKVLTNLTKLKSYQVSFEPKFYETRKQQQEEIQKVHKYVKIKQYTSEQPMGQRRNQKGHKKYLETKKMERGHTKTCEMQKKQF